jgi:hypothetical protein
LLDQFLVIIKALSRGEMYHYGCHLSFIRFEAPELE